MVPLLEIYQVELVWQKLKNIDKEWSEFAFSIGKNPKFYTYFCYGKPIWQNIKDQENNVHYVHKWKFIKYYVL